MAHYGGQLEKIDKMSMFPWEYVSDNVEKYNQRFIIERIGKVGLCTVPSMYSVCACLAWVIIVL